MALIQADRVRETSSTTGSAGFTLVGAVDGFQRFSAAIGSANTCYYAATDGSAFETGLGTVSANTLARTTVFDSSHTSSGTVHRVDFQAGTKDIFATYVADKAVILDADGNLTIGTTANITTLGNVSVAKTLTITSGVSGASTLNIKGAVSAGSTLGVKGNVSSEGTLSVIGAVSVGATLGVTNNASITGTFTFATASTTGNLDVAKNFSVIQNVSVGGTLGVNSNASITGTLAVTDEFTFATANSTGNLGVVKNASVGGTFHIEGNTSVQGTLNVKGAVSVSSTLGVEGDITNEVSSITVSSFSKILEIKGGGSNEGGIQLNCRDNSHGQKVIAQPHSEGVTNEMLLPKGANSTLVSEAGTATITNKTYFDTSGGLRQVPKSRSFGTALTTASTTDIGNFIFCAGTASSTQTLVIPDDTFTAGDIFSVVNNAKTADSTTTTFSAAQVAAVIAGAASATTLITLGVNGVASVLFTNASACVITGNVS